jgi:hypothetical protein
MSNRLLTLNAVVEDERVRDADPDVDVRLNAPVDSVNPLDAVRSPALVMVPPPVVEILPDVVIASPAVAVDSVVPVLDQYPSTPLVGAVLVNVLLASVYTALDAVSPPIRRLPDPPSSNATAGAVVPIPT